MSTSHHESLRVRHEVKGGSDRAFGVTVGGILMLIGAVRWFLAESGWPALGWLEAALLLVGAVLVLVGVAAPSLLAPLNRAWTRLGLVLFKVVNPIVMGLIYFLTVVPIGLIRRAMGHDPLHLAFDPKATSYWIERKPPGPAPDTMTNQF